MNTNILLTIECILGLAVIILIYMQPSKADALSGLINSKNNDTFFSKNKSRTKEAILRKCTWLAMGCFAVNTLLLNIH